MKRLVLIFQPIFRFFIVLGFLSCNIQVSAQTIKGLQQFSSDLILEGTVPVVQNQGINIGTQYGSFTDATGRTMFLRGINLGGSTKVPYSPNIGSHVKEGFFDGKDISFVGRPFPVKDADEHFKRLKAWGFHFVRFLVTWEAIEHEGPGIYDALYLDYVHTIIAKANTYGINVIIDPHQDLWSRYTGGDGAPLWTFEIAGLDVTKFQETGAAFVHNTYGDPFPRMIWYTNYFKLGSATMFTLFFGGNDFAPKTIVEGQPIQDFLQDHYIRAMAQLATKLSDLPNVIGFELMNEPSAGYIGIDDLEAPFHTDIMGDAPTAYQGMLLGAGIPQEVKNYRMGMVSLKENKPHLMNQQKQSVWKENNDIWQENGVWKLNANGTPEMMNKNYFASVKGQTVDFNTMYYEPFARKYAAAMAKINSNWIICVDNVLFPYPEKLPDLKKITGVNWINGSHWYDDVTLVKKKYLPFLGLDDSKVIFGRSKVKKAFENRLALMIKETHERYGNVPSLLGEFGIPYDMNNAKAFKSGNYKKQIKALNRSFEVIEANNLNYTLWNYTADNTNQRGDQWNGEDLSVFSISQQKEPTDINSGGRALEAAIRPYPKKINGQLTKYEYNYKNKKLLVEFQCSQLSEYPTEIFLPDFVYQHQFNVYCQGGKLLYDKKEQVLMYFPDKTGAQHLEVKPKK